MKKILGTVLMAFMIFSNVISVFAVKTKNVITGDLTVTTFFNEKTDAVELKSGDSYTFKFKNKCTGTNTLENYVMVIVGAEGDDYTGVEEEVLIVRADAWGWGGAMSDFVAPDSVSGNSLVFKNNIDWDSWLADAQAGMDCKVTISRDGDSLNYTAKIGKYNVSCTAASGITLPESCYVFFTGEKCILTGITTTKTAVETKKQVETETQEKQPKETQLTASNDQKLKPSVASREENPFLETTEKNRNEKETYISSASDVTKDQKANNINVFKRIDDKETNNVMMFIVIAVVLVVVIVGIVVVVCKKR